jgi:predicted  nucleic acid-binding Zn-ribbon protein
MKQVFLITILLLLAGAVMYAQQAEPPTSAQTKQSAQQFLSQSKTNYSEFDSTMTDLKARNGSNKDAYTFNRLKNEIERLETHINSEQKAIRSSLDRGTKVNTEVMTRVESFINQHREKVEELDAFVSSSN